MKTSFIIASSTLQNLKVTDSAVTEYIDNRWHDMLQYTKILVMFDLKILHIYLYLNETIVRGLLTYESFSGPLPRPGSAKRSRSSWR